MKIFRNRSLLLVDSTILIYTKDEVNNLARGFCFPKRSREGSRNFFIIKLTIYPGT